MCGTSVDELRKNKWLQVNDLYRLWREKWNEAHPNNKDTLSQGLFSNGCIKIDQLLRISRDELPLPVSFVTGKNQMMNVLAHKERTASPQGAGGLRRRKRPALVVGASRGKGLAELM